MFWVFYVVNNDGSFELTFGNFICMKNLIALICQLVGLFLILAFFFSLANYLFGLHLGMKGQEVPADPRAAISFLVIGLMSGAIAYFLSKGRGGKQAG